MLPSLHISSTVTPCIDTLHTIAATRGIIPAPLAESTWQLTLSAPDITLCTGDTTLFKIPAPTTLHTIAAALDSALHAWAQRPLYLGAGWQLSPTRKACLHATHKALELTDKECALLWMLASNQGTPCTQESLLSEIWAYDETIDSHTLQTHIYRLRSKCEQLIGLPLTIRNDNEGYTLLTEAR